MDLFEEKILSDCRKGKKDAFELLVRKYGNQVYRIVLPMVGCREDAKDISQDVFLKVYKNIDGFHAASSLNTWICAIALNTARDHLRKRKMTEVPYSESVLKEQGAVQANAIEHKERSMAVTEALEALEDDHREIIILKDLMGFSYDEIGGILALNPGTVRSRLSRARCALREELLKGGDAI